MPVAGATAHRALALGDMLRSLGEQRVRFAGIMATDARDVVFMANRIREQLPDARLFTLRADLTYLDERNARALNGMPPDLRRRRLEEIVERDRQLGDRVDRMTRHDELMAEELGSDLSDESPIVQAVEDGLEWEVLTGPARQVPRTEAGDDGRSGTGGT